MLTPAEWRAVDAVRHGLSDRVAARLRGVSRDAVRFHVRNALGKLGLASRHELRRWPGIPNTSLAARQEGVRMADLGPIGQVARTVRDVEASVRWYGTVLGLRHLYTYGRLAFFDCGGTRLFLSESERPNADESVLYFRVEDVHAAYEALLDRGVTFRGAPHMIHRFDDGAEEWMAFFDDPEGRPLAIMAQVVPVT